jgi:pyruvate/2-oxoglutarate dehydrogenase complex dihydrolipoamide dehydrogenase (E3) component
VFSRFGAEVTVVDVADRLVALEEPEAGELLADVFAREHIRVETGAKILNVSYDGELFKLDLDNMSPLVCERLLVAAGRRPDLSAIGAASVGIDEKQDAIPTDGSMRAGERLWAIGDVTGKGAFTHMSMYQARICVADILGREHEEAEYRAVPRVTFTDPEIGAVGMTESQAREAGVQISTGFTKLPESARGWIHKAGNDGFIKLVCDSSRGVLVGATSVGPSGGEVLGLLALAVHAEVPTDRLRHMIYAYPTFHRAIETALENLAS